MIRTRQTQARVALWATLILAVIPCRTASALTINLDYDADSTFTAAGLSPQDIIDMKAASSYAALQFTNNYTDPINVNIHVTAVPGTSTLGMSNTFLVSATYAALRGAAVADSTTADDATALGAGGALPAADPIGASHLYLVSTAQAKALGLAPDDLSNDGTFTFGGGFSYTYDPLNRAVAGKIDFIGVAMHEFSEIMGRIGLMGQNLSGQPDYMMFDLFHYTGAGVRGLNDGPGRFFSIDNGTTLLKAFNDASASPGTDLQDWASDANDSFNAVGSDSVENELTAVDLRVMDVIGYDLDVRGSGSGNTADGNGALASFTSGSFNTGIGFQALYSDNTGSYNTATGLGALYSNTSSSENTANGDYALYNNTTGPYNTAIGFGALFNNTTARANTATGFDALFSNTTGTYNTATGYQALNSNTMGSFNTANGNYALYNNTTASYNTATGLQALFSNTTGSQNTANGDYALFANTMGQYNTATGFGALYNDTSGNRNTATGLQALFSNSSGSNNIAIGYFAGSNLTTGGNNIEIGNSGFAGETDTIRIGREGTQTATFIAGIYGETTLDSGSTVPVMIDMNGNLGTTASSERFKKDIKPMDQSSEAILRLKPVTFHYKNDKRGTPQFGLVAEEVAKVNQDLVVRDAEGKVYTVRYDTVNAMLLNEFLKEHRKVEEQDRNIRERQETISHLKAAASKQEAINAEQQKELEDLTARLKEQALQIQKMSDQLEIGNATVRLVGNNE